MVQPPAPIDRSALPDKQGIELSNTPAVAACLGSTVLTQLQTYVRKACGAIFDFDLVGLV